MRGQPTVDTVTDSLDRSTFSETDGIAQIWLRSALLCVYFNEAQFLPRQKSSADYSRSKYCLATSRGRDQPRN